MIQVTWGGQRRWVFLDFKENASPFKEILIQWLVFNTTTAHKHLRHGSAQQNWLCCMSWSHVCRQVRTWSVVSQLSRYSTEETLSEKVPSILSLFIINCWRESSASSWLSLSASQSSLKSRYSWFSLCLLWADKNKTPKQCGWLCCRLYKLC